MIQIIWQNITYIGYAALLLMTVWLANFLLELYYSKMVIKRCGTVRECLKGVVKFLAICAGVTLLTVAISAFPPFLTEVGIAIPEEYVETISVLAIIVLFAKSVYEYAKSAMQKLNRILADELEDLNPHDEEDD